MNYYRTSLILILLTSLTSSDVNAQLLNTEVFLTITSDEFQDGIAVGETGNVHINITNVGPNPISSSDRFGVTVGYNITHDIDLFIDLVYSPTNDPDCNFIFPIASPRPPVNNISFFFYYEIAADIEVGATYTCIINTTFEQPGELETVWRMHYTTGNNTEVVDFPFTFRGQAIPVPINTNFMLIIAMIFISVLYLKKKKVKTE